TMAAKRDVHCPCLEKSNEIPESSSIYPIVIFNRSLAESEPPAAFHASDRFGNSVQTQTDDAR
ncbi:unnamed protein product, partial [Clavelina lepadiformis]